MSRDYKPRSTAKPKRQPKGGTLLGIFIGLVLGVAIAAGVVIYLNKSQIPFQARGGKAADKPNEVKVQPDEPAKTVAPQSLPGKPGDKVTEKPRFEFYKILPQDNSDETAAPPVAAAKPEAVPGGSAEIYYLQAGAFSSASDADNLKAKLALMGLEATVQQATTQDKGVLNRVRLGPYRSSDELGRIRNQLQQNGIQASIVKMKDTAAN